MNPQKFDGPGTLGGGNRVYVVLDQIGANKEKELSFGLKIVNKKGDELAKNSNNALIVTENSVGLINIQGWYNVNRNSNRGEIDSNTEGILKRTEVETRFQANASDIDIWLRGGTGIRDSDWKEFLGKIKEIENQKNKKVSDKQKELKDLVGIWTGKFGTENRQIISSLFSSMWFDNKKSPTGGWVTITAEWNPWCGTLGNKYDKRLTEDGSQGELVGENYKNAKSGIDLRVGPIQNSGTEDKWALIPIGKSIMKINLSSGSFNNETIEGTLELINNFLIIFYCLYVKKQWNLSYKLRYFTHILSSNKSADLKISFRSTESFLIEWSKLS